MGKQHPRADAGFEKRKEERVHDELAVIGSILYGDDDFDIHSQHVSVSDRNMCER